MMNNRKKIPLRKCVATGEMKPKKELDSHRSFKRRRSIH